MTIETVILLCILGGLMGSMLFFAAIVAPTTFQSLQPEQAGSYLRAIFPRYYLWCLVLATSAAVLAYGIEPTVFAILSGVTVLFIGVRAFLLPVINRARDARIAGETGAEQRFRRLHRVSVLINLSQMMLLIASIILLL